MQTVIAPHGGGSGGGSGGGGANVSWILGHLGYAYGVSGKRPHALKTLRKLEKRAERSCVSSYAFALIHMGLDNRAQALQMIQRTCEDRNEMLGFPKTHSGI
jgi:hypothetical protein